MTSKRNLGPVLALTGAGVAVAAVIAGFIAVGGPGDARERRLDDLAMNRVAQAIGIAQCAFNATGAAPASMEEARKVRSASPNPGDPAPFCGGDQQPNDRITAADQPAMPGDVTYRAADATHVHVCSNFRRAVTGRAATENHIPLGDVYPQLRGSHPAGIHCFDIELVKGNNPASHKDHTTIIQ